MAHQLKIKTKMIYILIFAKYKIVLCIISKNVMAEINGRKERI